MNQEKEGKEERVDKIYFLSPQVIGHRVTVVELHHHRGRLTGKADEKRKHMSLCLFDAARKKKKRGKLI